MWSAIQAELLNLLVTVVVGLLGLLGVYILNYINQLKNNLKQKAKNDLVDVALDRLEYLVGTTVTALEQSIAEDLRAMVKDGKADRKELLAVGVQAFEAVKDGLQDSTKEVLRDTFTDLDTLIMRKIDDALYTLKQQKLAKN